MLTAKQQKTAAFIATVAAAVFGGIQLWPSFASLNKSETTSPISSTAVAPGGIAISGGSLGAHPTGGSASTQVTINNSDPATLEFLKQEIEKHERQKHAALSLEAKLVETERSLQIWQFWYFRSSHPLSIEMLKDLALLKNHEVKKDEFDARWANLITPDEIRKIYINDILVHYGWAVDKNGSIKISESGSNLLESSGVFIAPHQTNRQAKPSFDCDRAEKWYERMICSDSELAALDLEMAGLFKQLQSHPSKSAQSLNASQIDWRNKVRNICQDRACLIQSYATRIKQLKIVMPPQRE